MTSSDQDRYQTDELRVLHWNIHSWRDESGGSNLDAVVDLVQATNPHVVSLVEVDEAWGTRSAVRELADRCDYSSVFVPSFEFGQEAPAGGFGNALLTKLPILAVLQRSLTWPPRIYDGTEPSEARAVVLARLRYSSKSFWIGSTHLPRNDECARTDALHRLVAFTKDLYDDWMVCGDFNTPASSWPEEYRSLAMCPGPAEATHPADQPVEPIDYCVATSGLMMEGNALSVSGSDHLPILVLAQLA